MVLIGARRFKIEGHRVYEHGRLIRVRYLDHAIFLNARLKGVGSAVRESLGHLGGA